MYHRTIETLFQGVGKSVHTMYILYRSHPAAVAAECVCQLLVLLERCPILEEFNHLTQDGGDPSSLCLTSKTIDLAISNDQVWPVWEWPPQVLPQWVWQQVCNHLGWKFVPTV